MSFSKFIVIPIMVAVLAFTLQIVDQLLSPIMPPDGNKGFAWIAFQAWAVYFFAGGTLKGGVKSFLGYVMGILASISIMLLAGKFAGLELGFFAVPGALGLIVIPVMCLEKIKILDLIPALFIGAGAFFVFMSYVPNATFGTAAFTELVYCVIGLFYGVATVFLRGQYEAMINPKK